jgi:ubiquinone biosynthesis accessory factor UbiK
MLVFDGARLDISTLKADAMLDPKLLEDLSARISTLLANTPVADFEKNLRAVLVAQFSKLDLVTRDDFEIQKALLSRAQERLAALEQRLAEIEGQR